MSEKTIILILEQWKPHFLGEHRLIITQHGALRCEHHFTGAMWIKCYDSDHLPYFRTDKKRAKK